MQYALCIFDIGFPAAGNLLSICKKMRRLKKISTYLKDSVANVYGLMKL